MPPDRACTKLRIRLPSAIVVAAIAGNLPAEADTLLLFRMFEQHAGFKAAVAAGAGRQQVQIGVGIPDAAASASCAEVITATLLPSGRVFRTTNTGASGAWEIIEVPPGSTLRYNVAFQRSEDPSRRDCCVPGMVPACCAGCGASGAPSFKTCAACRLVHYCGASPLRVGMMARTRVALHCAALHCAALLAAECRDCGVCAPAGKECQRAHWPEHKAACKAARTKKEAT
jgi:hypothetical protein